MKFIICAAGSGGHIYPALSLANQLKSLDKNSQIVFFTTKKAIDKEILKENDYKVVRVGFIPPYSATGINSIKFYLKNLYFLLKFMIESVRVFFLVRFITPDLIIGFGGIGSVAAVISARIFNIPSLIHEQNIVPGLANRVLSKFATEIAVGYKESNVYFNPRQGIVTGNPLRYDLEKMEKGQARSSLQLDLDKFTVLIFGGSQGSDFINRCFIEVINGLTAEKRGTIQVIHCTGSKDVSVLKAEYEKLAVQAKVFTYCNMMSNAYSASDLVIGRSGAATLNEVCYFQKAAILIPYPFARAHQRINAEFMQDKGAACMVKQDEHCRDHLLHLINSVIDHRHILESMTQKCKELFQGDGASKLAKLAMEMASN